MKRHLARIKSDAVSCKMVPVDIRYQLEQNLKEIDGKKSNKQDNYEENNPYGLDVTPLESDTPILEEVSSTQVQQTRESHLNNQAPNTSQLGK